MSAQSIYLSFTTTDQIAVGKKYSAGHHAAIPRWVGANEPAHHTENGYGMRRSSWSGADHDRAPNGRGVCNRPFERLLPAEASADYG